MMKIFNKNIGIDEESVIQEQDPRKLQVWVYELEKEIASIESYLISIDELRDQGADDINELKYQKSLNYKKFQNLLLIRVKDRLLELKSSDTTNWDYCARFVAIAKEKLSPSLIEQIEAEMNLQPR